MSSEPAAYSNNRLTPAERSAARSYADDVRRALAGILTPDEGDSALHGLMGEYEKLAGALRHLANYEGIVTPCDTCSECQTAKIAREALDG